MDRKIWMDILNIVAIIGVVILHCNSEIYQFDGDVSVGFIWQSLIVSIFYWPVNVFFLITGANLIGYKKGWKTYTMRRLRRTVIPYVAWSIIYCLLICRDIQPKTFIENIANGGMIVYFWYFIPLFIVYLSIPFVTSIVHNSSKKLIEAFLIISFVTLSIIPTTCQLCEIAIKRDYFPMGSSFIAISLCGYYLLYIHSKYQDITKTKLICFLVGVICVNWISLISYAFMFGNLLLPLMSYFNPFCVLTAIAVFLFFSIIDWRYIINIVGIKEDSIALISSCTLGIYIFHPIVFLAGDHFGIDLFRNDYFGFIPTYLISLFVIWGMKKIPYIKLIVP